MAVSVTEIRDRISEDFGKVDGYKKIVKSEIYRIVLFSIQMKANLSPDSGCIPASYCFV